MSKNNEKQRNFEHKMASPCKMTKMHLRHSCIEPTIYTYNNFWFCRLACRIQQKSCSSLYKSMGLKCCWNRCVFIILNRWKFIFWISHVANDYRSTFYDVLLSYKSFQMTSNGWRIFVRRCGSTLGTIHKLVWNVCNGDRTLPYHGKRK